MYIRTDNLCDLCVLRDRTAIGEHDNSIYYCLLCTAYRSKFPETGVKFLSRRSNCYEWSWNWSVYCYISSLDLRLGANVDLLFRPNHCDPGIRAPHLSSRVLAVYHFHGSLTMLMLDDRRKWPPPASFDEFNVSASSPIFCTRKWDIVIHIHQSPTQQARIPADTSSSNTFHDD